MTPLNSILASIEVTPSGAVLETSQNESPPQGGHPPRSSCSARRASPFPVETLERWLTMKGDRASEYGWSVRVLKRRDDGMPARSALPPQASHSHSPWTRTDMLSDSALLGLPAPAKLNLFLHVVGRRPDGKHLLESVFTLIDLHDTIDLFRLEEPVVERTGDVIGNVEKDLCVRAARLLMETFDVRSRRAHPC